MLCCSACTLVLHIVIPSVVAGFSHISLKFVDLGHFVECACCLLATLSY